MITAYNKDMAVVDIEWLNRVGSAFAVAYYEQDCYKILRKMEKAQNETEQIEQLLTDDSDPTGNLVDHLHLLQSVYSRELENRLQVAENRLFAIHAHEWVDKPVSEISLRELGNPRLITREEFENDWQKAEAGY